MTSTHCARPAAERCERPTSACDNTAGDHPGRLAQGPDEKHGLAGRRVGFIASFPSIKVRRQTASDDFAWRGEPYVRARCRSIQRRVARGIAARHHRQLALPPATNKTKASDQKIARPM